MRVRVYPRRAQGSVLAPPSKSMAHRLLICAAMSEGESVISGISPSQDVLATLDCIRALGAEAVLQEGCVTVRGINMLEAEPKQPLCCRESGSTLRFFIPIALLSGKPAVFHGTEPLMKRPMFVYRDICREKQLEFTQDGQEITVKGRLLAGEYTLAGDVSSQFISGLLFALPMADGNSVIHITPPVESRSYLDLTVDALRTFGVNVIWQDDHTIEILGNQRYQPQSTTVEGDYSNAAFLDVFNCIGGNVNVTGLRRKSLQGDRVYADHFQALCEGRAEIRLGNCPDLAPILFTLAAVKHGGVFYETRRLRIKESDRASVMAEELRKFGINVLVEEDMVTVEAGRLQQPTEMPIGHNDHRVVMSMTVLLSLTGGVLDGAEAVSKSYPDFFDQLRRLGLKIVEE